VYRDSLAALIPQHHNDDIGCGTGGQTMVLSSNTPCHIIGIDLFNYNAEKSEGAVYTIGFKRGINESMSGISF
jgi:cyclopropane fatty-acyl-phospholipid synthase-like methyltransferase